MATVSEIAPDLFRVSTFVPDFNLQFNQFLVRDAEPLLFHTGPRGMFASEGKGGRESLLERLADAREFDLSRLFSESSGR
jgi:hypothetical protein